MHHRRALHIAWILIFVLATFAPLRLSAKVSAVPIRQEPYVTWTDVQEYMGGVYFLYTGPVSTIKHYAMGMGFWMPEVAFPRPLTTFAVDSDYFFLADERSVYRANQDGSSLTHLYDIDPDDDWIESLHVTENALLVNIRDYGDGIFVAIDKTTGAIIDNHSAVYRMLVGVDVAHNGQMLAGRMEYISPSDVIAIPINSDGSFGAMYESPYHGDYPTGKSVWFFPDDTKILDAGGTVYRSTDLVYQASLGRKVEAAAFVYDLPVILNNGVLYSYDANMLETERFYPAAPPADIFSFDNIIYAFSDGADRPAVERIQLVEFEPPKPALPIDHIDPFSLAIAADQIEVGPDDTVYMLHKASRNILRWSPSTRQYLPSIPLIDDPSSFTIDWTGNSIYVIYANGRYNPSTITSIALNNLPAEHTFAHLPWESDVTLTVMNDNILTTYSPANNAFVHFTVLDRDGAPVSFRQFGSTSSEYIWNAAKNLIYYTDDRTTNKYLYGQPVTAGVLGEPFHGEMFELGTQIHPVRVNQAGTDVLTGSGRIFDGDTLGQKGWLSNSVTDGVFTPEGLFTIRSVTGGSQVQRWNESYALAGTSPALVGQPQRMLPVNGGLVVATLHNGKTRLSVLDRGLNVVATPPLIGSIFANPASGDPPLRAQFSAQILQGQNLAYYWKFGDGQTATEAAPMHEYTRNGVYTVSLVVSNAGGQDVWTAKDLIALNDLVANFSADRLSGLAPLKVQFENLTNGIVFDTIHWDFGDGATSTEMHPFHVYTQPGIYSVSLTMTGPGGEDTKKYANYIQARWGSYLPVVMYTYHIYTVPGTYIFNKCQSFIAYKDQYGTITMTECVESIEARADGYLKFNFSWRAYYSGSFYGCLTKYSDEGNRRMYITNQDGLVYHHKEVGEAAGYIGCMNHDRVYRGWFLFPPAADSSTVFTFHDQDNEVQIKNLAIPVK